MVFETAGKKVTTSQTSYLARRVVSVVIVGNVQGDVPFNFRNLCTAEIELETTKRYCNAFEKCLSAINTGSIPAEKLNLIIDNIFRLSSVTSLCHKSKPVVPS